MKKLIMRILPLFWLTSAPANDALLVNYDTGSGLPSGAAVVGTAGDVWNQSWDHGNAFGWYAAQQSDLATLVDSDGAVIPGASLTCTRDGSANNDWDGVRNNKGPTSNPAPFDFSLGIGGGEPNSHTLVWTVSGLPEGDYDVYVFYGWDATWPVQVAATVNGTTSGTFTYAPATAYPVMGRDYVAVSNVTATAGGVIEISIPCSDSNAGLSGFQIEKVISPGGMTLLIR